jgi:DNA-binding transcriptional LysR family regulator
MQWDSLRYVLAVHSAGSVTAAAGRLGVDAVTVSRRIKAIEKQLGVRLFDRTRKGYVATASALEIARQAERMEEEVGALERRIWGRDKELQGVVRVTAPDTTGAFILAPLLPQLHQLHPGITVDLNVDNRVLNISKRDADIAIRPTTQPPDNLIGHRLAPIVYAPYAAARLLPRGKARRGALTQFPWVGLDSSFAGSRVGTYQRYLESQAQGGRVILRVNSSLAMACAVQAGVGLGVLSCITAARLGGLVRLGPFIDELTTELWILTHPELRDVARVATVYAFLRDEIRKLRPVFLGKEGESRPARSPRFRAVSERLPRI